MNSRNQRRALLGIASFAGVAAVFASGFLVARAFENGGTSENLGRTAPDSSSLSARPTSGGTTGYGRDDVVTIDRAGVGTSIAPAPPEQSTLAPGFGGCPGSLDDVLAGDTLNLASDGFRFVRLGDGFQMSSFSVSSARPCEPGNDADDVIFATSAWLHAESGDSVWISQNQQAERSANVEYPGVLNFWNEGYWYTVNANAAVLDLPESRSPEGSARDSASGLLDSVFAAIAPKLDRSCFYRQSHGSWSDLPALGIGDPRSALPSSYSEVAFYLTRWSAPPASCGEPAMTTGGATFNAQFTDGKEGFLSVEAYESGEGSVGPADEIHDYGVSWTRGKYAFSVWQKSAEPIGQEAIVKIAQAIDPAFSPSCLRRTRTLTDAELAGLGLPSPAVPEGFAIGWSSLAISEVGAECQNPGVVQATYNLSWTLENKGTVIDVSVVGMSRFSGPAAAPSGFIWDSGMTWVDVNGTQYFVTMANPGGTPQTDVVTFVAKSLDPGLDVQTLSQGANVGVDAFPRSPVKNR